MKKERAKNYYDYLEDSYLRNAMTPKEFREALTEYSPTNENWRRRMWDKYKQIL